MANRFTNLMSKVRGKPKPVVSAVGVTPVVKVKKVDAQAEAMSFIKKFRLGARNVDVTGIDRDILKFLVVKGVIVVDGPVALICPGIFSCTRCGAFSAAASKFEYSKCLKRGIDLQMSGANTQKARSCSDFDLAILQELK